MTSSLSIVFVKDGNVIGVPLPRRRFFIGSAEENDVVIGNNAPEIACLIEPEGGFYTIAAMSKTMVLVNGKKTRKCRITKNDIVTINDFTFTIDASATEPSPEIGYDGQAMANLLKFVTSVGKERNLAKLLKKMIATLVEITGGTEILIFKLDNNGCPQVFESNRGDNCPERFSDTIVRHVIESKSEVHIPSTLHDPEFGGSRSIADLKLTTVVCAPVIASDKCMGVIYIGSNNAGVSFSKTDLEVVKICAAVTGLLFNHIDFIAEQQQTIERLSITTSDDGIIATCSAMRTVLSSVNAIADTSVSVLLTGETGCGKSRIAELIHKKSVRAQMPFVVVNCSALHGELLESELFGHKRGSFTGAAAEHDGLFTVAHRGTIVLDEVGELELSLQAKLLRTLETGLIRPVGSSVEHKTEVRIICATNRDLAAMVKDKMFRADLYYRINQFAIHIPPLRERGEDTVLLAYELLNNFQMQYPDKKIRGIHPDTLSYIRNHAWEGNIRELSNMLHRSVLLATGDLIECGKTEEGYTTGQVDFETATRHYQKSIIERAVLAAQGNKEVAAKSIGLSRSTFYRYAAQLDIK